MAIEHYMIRCMSKGIVSHRGIDKTRATEGGGIQWVYSCTTIAKAEDGWVTLNDGGFRCSCTLTRLNALLSHYQCDNIVVKDSVWHIGNSLWDGMYSFSANTAYICDPIESLLENARELTQFSPQER